MLKTLNIKELHTNRENIAVLAIEREEENDAFREHLRHADGYQLDKLVKDLNNDIAPLIDCTQCGACCSSLMINVLEDEIPVISKHLDLTGDQFKSQFIEESQQGQMIMKSIPCSFLNDKKCNVYEKRFTECRDFPHLHKDNFKGRIFGTLVHYAMCPIIFNVIEALKTKTGFKAESI